MLIRSSCILAVIEAHARDELGIDTDDMANPWLACITSAISFSIGAAIPLLSSSFIKDHVIRYLPDSVHPWLDLAVCMMLNNCNLRLCLKFRPGWCQLRSDHAILPLSLTQLLCSFCCRLIVVLVASTVALAVFGAIGAILGGANPFGGAIRVVIGGTLITSPCLLCVHIPPDWDETKVCRKLRM